MRRRVPPAMLVLLAGCGGQIGEEFPVPCLDTETTVASDVPIDALGETSDAVWQRLSGTRDAAVTWTGGATARLELVTSALTADPTWVASERNPSWADEASCVSALLLPVALGMSTDDGALADSWDVVLRTPDGTGATFGVDTQAASLQGDGVPGMPRASDYEDLRFLLDGELTAETSDGTLTAFGYPSDATDEPDTVVLGTWGPP